MQNTALVQQDKAWGDVNACHFRALQPCSSQPELISLPGAALL